MHLNLELRGGGGKQTVMAAKEKVCNSRIDWWTVLVSLRVILT